MDIFLATDLLKMVVISYLLDYFPLTPNRQ